MIYKLQDNEYKKLQPLFQDLRYNLVIVIAGNTLAWVYADSPPSPWPKKSASQRRSTTPPTVL